MGHKPGRISLGLFQDKTPRQPTTSPPPLPTTPGHDQSTISERPPVCLTMTPLSPRSDPPISIDPAFGLEWKEDDGSRIPSWSVEPNILDLQAIYKGSVVRQTTEGTYNKIYRIEVNHESLILRITLPIDAPRKVESEVATMSFIRQHTVRTSLLFSQIAARRTFVSGFLIL